ncbi:MAG: hypothetical protein CMG46_02540 [Candidatus Marinimicrobia bacterium]|nr:hypothetical protein [Candidatus Neomarinimicrobiota bacterium]|tara:strand:+ start:227 stop:562 length:336 start_codon:yes stop_codon:yes gene_type:complete
MKLLKDIEDNKYFFGFIMIFINIGSRFLIDELSDEQKKYINTKLFRRIILFCIFFMATKDILASFTLTIIFILFVSDMFKDNSKSINESRESIIGTIENDINIIQQKLKKL